MSLPQRVAFIHYHLRGGGVTRVLRHQQTALRERGIDSAVVVGEEPPPDTGLENICLIRGLGYAGHGTARSSDAILRDLDEQTCAPLGGRPDLWHIHNHSLGKNVTLPHLVDRLAHRGDPLLLQIHDFAEDGRPGNYAYLKSTLATHAPGAILYPQAPQIHYACLNSRDTGFLRAAGMPTAQTHCLPNAIHLDDAALAEIVPAPFENLVLYPTRGIRRKNVGEAVLWAQVLRDTHTVGMTLAPQNPAQRVFHDWWVDEARSQGVPMRFELATEHEYLSLLACATRILTTSIAEGFGLAFLEPSLMRKPLAGRALPEITDEFASAGFDLSGLYARLDVPLDWVGADTLRDTIRTAATTCWAQYEATLTDDDLEHAYASAAENDLVDIGHLDETLQQTILTRIVQSASDRAALRRQWPAPASQEVLHKNREIVRDQFSLQRAGERLIDTYQQILRAPRHAPDSLPAGAVLKQFLHPERFNLLRT